MQNSNQKFDLHSRAGMPCSLSSSAPRPMRIRSKNFPISPTHEPATPIIFPDCIGTRGQTTWPERYATFGEDLRRNDIEQRLQNRTVCNVTATDSYLARRWLSLVQKFIPITDDYLWIDGAELNERPSEFSPPPLFWSGVIHLVGLISRRVVSLSSFGRVSGADAEKGMLHAMH